jgi:hypothetical protein
MAVLVPRISCCVLNHHNLFYQIQNALAFNWDTCCHIALCLRLLPFHTLNKTGQIYQDEESYGVCVNIAAGSTSKLVS